MRPVQLEMDGFASYRQYTKMDFGGVDYFALVGPTGAGKSTIIDAITFALYGCVVRWDDARAVEPALAPTVNRGSLKLVFDAGRDRYIAARILQRSAAGKVGQKTARLERLIDPSGLGTPDDATEVIADGIDETKKAVERLLGLDFSQFTKCVALPQGQFAELLHAKAGDRDKILTKLLGLDVYLQIGQVANKRAAVLKTKADTLQHQLDDEKFDSTDAALAAAEARDQNLQDLRSRIDDEVARLTALIESADAANREREEREREIERLERVTIPVGTDDLDERVEKAVDAEAKAEAGAEAAERNDSDARTALGGYPKRSVLERLRDSHAERERLQALKPELSYKATAATEAAKRAEEAVQRARSELETARAKDTAAADAYRQAAETEKASTERQRLLQAVKAPDGLDEIIYRIADAQGRAAEAEKALVGVKQRWRIAEAALGEHPAEVDLERASRSVHDARNAAGRLREAAIALSPFHQSARGDRSAAIAAAEALAEAKAEADVVQTRTVAAGLRSHLEVGDECPVCDQRVADLPAPLDATDAVAAKAKVDAAQKLSNATAHAATRSETKLDASRESLIAAAHELTVLLAAASAAVSSVVTPAASLAMAETTLDTGPFERVGVDTEVESLAAGCAALVERLDALKTGLDAAAEHLAAAQAARSAAVTATKEAESAVAKADERERAAQVTLEATAVERDAARQALQQTRDPLVALGAPALDDQNLAAAWDRLATWAAKAAEGQADQVKLDAQALAAKDSDRNSTGEALDRAEQSASTAEAQHTERITSQERTAADFEQCEKLLSSLETELDGARTAEDVAEQLSKLALLESDAEGAAKKLGAARQTRSAAKSALDDVRVEERSARTALNAARDELSAIAQPPVLDGVRIAKAWADLVEWSAAAAAKAKESLDKAAAIAEKRVCDSNKLDSEIRRLLTEADVAADDSRSPDVWAAAAVAAAGAQTTAAVQYIKQARDHRALTVDEITKAREHSAVAKQLGDLLAVNGFPRWLNRNALEVLVTSASRALMDLSGGQFELSLSEADDANFAIIDHADADAVRPVKTLSGGETFQASLALALALAQNLGALANNGAVQLEALFVDEGFGTLDENTLEVVADTLESLAMNVGRMVGVITHVPGLAARVPVRFRVNRDPRGSTVHRETL